MMHRNLLQRMYSLYKVGSPVHNVVVKKIKEQQSIKQEAQYQIQQLPVSVPKQVAEYWESLAMQKRKELLLDET